MENDQIKTLNTIVHHRLMVQAAIQASIRNAMVGGRADGDDTGARPMIAEPESRTRLSIRPWGSNLLVRYTETAEQTSGGVWLPERMRQNFTEAEVVEAGPGMRMPVSVSKGNLWPNGSISYFPPWPRRGDTITFQREKAQAISETEAIIDAEDVLALVLSDRLIPLSDWVAVRPEPGAQETRGGIRLSDKVQRYRQRGTILDYGGGILEMEGTCALRRRTVHEILNLPWDMPLAGLDVIWRRDATVLQMGRQVVECWLVRARDLVAIVVED